ncbi:hypothetical protein CDIK_2612 [Cucumispora dikerogammari]|nr:hypothetical protein CDIK_2612 [Cucumispora dikerogammari]
MKTLDGFKLVTQILVTALLSLCSAFFNGFIISSRIRFYMHFFQAYIIVESFILCIFIVYGIIYGETSFMKEANLDKRNGGSVLFSNIEAQYGNQGTDTLTLEFINQIHKQCNTIYLSITTAILALNLICFVICKVCLKIKCTEEELIDRIVLPNMRTNKVGMSSSSLRKRYMKVKEIYPTSGLQTSGVYGNNNSMIGSDNNRPARSSRRVYSNPHTESYINPNTTSYTNTIYASSIYDTEYDNNSTSRIYPNSNSGLNVNDTSDTLSYSASDSSIKDNIKKSLNKRPDEKRDANSKRGSNRRSDKNSESNQESE